MRPSHLFLEVSPLSFHSPSPLPILPQGGSRIVYGLSGYFSGSPLQRGGRGLVPRTSYGEVSLGVTSTGRLSGLCWTRPRE